MVLQWKEDVMTYRSWSGLLHGSCGLITQTNESHAKRTSHSFLSCSFFFQKRSTQGHNLVGKLSKVDRLDFPCLDSNLLSLVSTSIGLNAAKVYKPMKTCIIASHRPRCNFLPSNIHKWFLTWWIGHSSINTFIQCKDWKYTASVQLFSLCFDHNVRGWKELLSAEQRKYFQWLNNWFFTTKYYIVFCFLICPQAVQNHSGHPSIF